MIQIKHSILKFPFIALLLFMTFSLTACIGDSQPSESDIKSMAAQYFDNQYSGLFITSNVIKKNGYKQNETHYVAELTITGTAQQDLDSYAKSIMNDSSLSSLEKITNSMAVGLLKMTMPDFEAGDQIEFEKNYLFIKTDNGWQLKNELKPEDQL
ncbi:hypothetical protein [Thiomicrorhabdus sp. Milos-T2]|uniref:hypothetical protein n=1 Tax=Thiomicrorhabdus sp. Milos-T2 TaxID=90814 RepID=UPI0004941F72|nr:hypothetical protein [Thiomicrorhabdus sp. Milos-T2]